MFISQAYAQGTGGGGVGGDLIGTLLPLIMIMGVFWFLIIRPQQKRAKEHKEMVANIRRGDTVVTTGGIVGKVSKVVDEREVLVDVAENVRLRFLKNSVAEVRVKGEPAKDDTSSK